MARFRDVVRALGCLSAGEGMSVEGWEQQRALGLVAVKEMLVTLREGGMLKAEGGGVLGRLEGTEEKPANNGSSMVASHFASDESGIGSRHWGFECCCGADAAAVAKGMMGRCEGHDENRRKD